MKKTNKLLLATLLTVSTLGSLDTPALSNTTAYAQQSVQQGTTKNVDINSKLEQTWKLTQNPDGTYTVEIAHTNKGKEPLDVTMYLKSSIANMSQSGNYENTPKEGTASVIQKNTAETKKDGVIIAMKGITGTFKETYILPKEALNEKGELPVLLGLSLTYDTKSPALSYPNNPNQQDKTLWDRLFEHGAATPLLGDTQPVYFNLKPGEVVETKNFKWEPIAEDKKAENLYGKNENYNTMKQENKGALDIKEDKYAQLGFLDSKGNKATAQQDNNQSKEQTKQTETANQASGTNKDTKTEETPKTEEKSNTGLFIGGGAAVLAILGGILVFFKRKQ